MQDQKEKPVNKRWDPELFVTIARFMWRFRSDPDVLEPFLTWAKEEGFKSDEDISALRSALLAWRKTIADRTASYRVDRYLTIGMGAVDLVLFPVIFTMGVVDRSLFIALLSLVISLIFVPTSLVVSVVKEDAGITAYGKLHSWLNSFAVGFGATAMIATVWHLSVFIGVVFLILAVAAFLAFAVYFSGLRWALEYGRIIQAALATSNPDRPELNTQSGE